MVRAIAIGESPPAVQLSENQIHPTSATLVLQRHELSRRCQQLPAVHQRLVEILRRMQHVSGNHQVITVGVKALSLRILLDIQDAVFDRHIRLAETPLRVREEARGDVGVRVVELPSRKPGQDALGRRPNARANLQHPEPPSVGQPGRDILHHLSQHLVRGFPHRCPPIQVGSLRFRVAEQQRQRILTAAQHLRQRPGASPEEPDLVRTVRVTSAHAGGILLGILRHCFRQRIFRPDRHHEALARRLQHARPGQYFENPAEQLRVIR